jgi:hypothetical protein
MAPIIAEWNYVGACATQSAEFYKNGTLMANPIGSGASVGSFTIVPGDILDVYHNAGTKGASCISAIAVIEVPYLSSNVVNSDFNTGSGVTAYVSWTVSGSDDVGLYAGLTP